MTETWGEPLTLQLAADQGRRATAAIHPVIDDYQRAVDRLTSAPSDMPVELPRRDRSVTAVLEDLDHLSAQLDSFGRALEHADAASHYPGHPGFRVGLDDVTFEALSAALLHGDAHPWRALPDVVHALELIRVLIDTTPPSSAAHRADEGAETTPDAGGPPSASRGAGLLRAIDWWQRGSDEQVETQSDTLTAMQDLIDVVGALPAAGVDALLEQLADEELHRLGARIDRFPVDRQESLPPSLSVSFWSHLAAHASPMHVPRIVDSTDILNPPIDGLLPEWAERGDRRAESFGVEALAYVDVGSRVFARGHTDGHPVHRSDITQGMIGDCWFVAAMIVVADRDPHALHRMVRENPNGTVTIRFPDDVEVTVTKDVVADPTWDRPRPLFAGIELNPHEHDTEFLDEGPELWPALISKAYAQRVGGWTNMVGGLPLEGFEVLGGWETAAVSPLDLEPGQIGQWFAEGHGIVLATRNLTAIDSSRRERDLLARRKAFFDANDGIVARHGYVVDGVKRDGTVVASNPWHPGRPPIELRPDELDLVIASVTVAAPPRGPAPIPPPNARPRRHATVPNRRSASTGQRAHRQRALD